MSHSDAKEVLSINDGFFNDYAEIIRYVNNNSILGFRNRNDELPGCGILTRIIEGSPAIDIGMLVAPSHRNMGIGTYIANHLKEYCVQRGDIPIAGCDASNIGSSKALMAAGFISEHNLLEIIL